MSEASKPYGDPTRSRILYIGHDPRLQESDTIAEFAFFADYYFRPKPVASRELKKYELATAMFQMVDWLTGGTVRPEEVVATNLCNRALPHAPKKKMVLIPENQAVHGISELRRLLSGSPIQAIVATSLQVNYWLQQLGFCSANVAFLEDARPTPAGLLNAPPFYKATRDRAFTHVCGQRFLGPYGIPVYPTLHVKQWSWPLKPSLFDAYAAAHERCRELIQQELTAGIIREEVNDHSPIGPTGLA
jgi:hypothetical protein